MANVGMPLQFTRMYSGPLDDSSIFESLEAANAYAIGPLSYGGQLISIKIDEEYILYIINEDKSIKTVNVTVEPTWETM